MVVKTFRGLMADGGQDRIRLGTIKGKVGYRIVKFQIIGAEPGQQDQEHTVKMYKSKQSTINNNIDFTDSDLLAAAYIQDDSGQAYTVGEVVIFDNEIFNQDIFVTHSDTTGTQPCNYYIELEVIPMDDAGAEYTTLKDMRST